MHNYLIGNPILIPKIKMKDVGMNDLFNCEICGRTNTGDIIKFETPLHPIYWRMVACTYFHSEWHICLSHVSTRWSSDKPILALEHFRTQDHVESVVDNSVSSLVVNGSCSTVSCLTVPGDDVPDDVSRNAISPEKYDLVPNRICKRKLSHVLCNELFNKSSMCDASIRYFMNEMCHDDDGLRSLVGCAFSGSHISDSVADVNESKFHLQLLGFMKDLTGSQQLQFMDLFGILLNDKNMFKKTRLPRTISDGNKFYLSGNNAMKRNLHQPTVFTLENHACVSLKDLIEHLIGNGLDIDIIYQENICNDSVCNPVDSIIQSQAAIDICEEVYGDRINPPNTLILYVIFWSDDFEVIHTKKRNSVWIMTVTVSTPHRYSSSPRYNHSLSLGFKGMDPILYHYFEELKELNKCNYMFCGRTNKLIPVVVKLLIYADDLPERSSINCILSHNGKSTCLWLYSALIYPNTLRSCCICIRRRLKYVKDMNISDCVYRCAHCDDWDYSKESMLYTFSPTNYPNSSHSDIPPAPKYREAGLDKILPVKMSYSLLQTGCAYCFYNLYKGEWTKSQANCYLRVLGVKEEYSKSNILDKAMNLMIYPNYKGQWLDELEYPAIWRQDICLKQCIDTPMHQLFQGVVKSIMEYVTQWLKDQNLHK